MQWDLCMHHNKMNDLSDTIAFRTDKDVDNDASDIWDDTALIKAYDKAIKSIRGGASNEESGGAESRQNGAGSSSRRTKCKKRKHSNQRKNKKKRVWKVGDRCRAVYTEDEYVYDAVIKLIDHGRATCWVTFDSYGNEEEKDLDELMSAGSEAASPTRPANWDFEAGYESVESEARGHTHSAYRPDSSWYPPRHPFTPPMPVPMHWPPHPMSHGFFPHGPPPFPHFPGSGYMAQGLGLPVPPSIPPPPPTPLPAGVQEGDDEALHAMLMSWYMSGYHTGYYQGLKEGRSAGRSAPLTTPERQTASRRPRSQNSGMQSR